MSELPQNFIKNEARLMLWIPVGIIVAAILAAILIPILNKQIAIDRCLDAGGAFDYKAGQCIEINRD
jgi:hypothetical protein